MTSDSHAIDAELNDSVAIIRFNRPAERNPLSLDTLYLLKSILTEYTNRDDVKALVITGAGDVFASGANIRELAQLNSTSALQFSTMGQQLFQSIAGASQVTIAAINGYCMGGALDLALACDIRVASKNAVFAHPGANLGIITGWGGTQRLPRVIGRARALELFLTARNVRSDEALAIRLITGIGDPVLNYAVAIARKLPSPKASANPGFRTL